MELGGMASTGGDARYPLSNISNSGHNRQKQEPWDGKKAFRAGSSPAFQNPKRAKQLLIQAWPPLPLSSSEVQSLSGVEFEPPQLQHPGDLPSFHHRLVAKIDDPQEEIADQKTSEIEVLSEVELEEPQLEQYEDLPYFHPLTTTDHSKEIADQKTSEDEDLSEVELEEPQLEQSGDLPYFHPLTNTDHSKEIAETSTKTASEDEHNGTPLTPLYHTPTWLDHPNLQEVSTSNVSKPNVYNTCEKNHEEVLVMSCPQLYRNHRTSLRGQNSGTVESCQKNVEQLLYASSIQGGSTFSKKSSSRRKSLPASFVHRQISYFAEVDAFELEEEEATSEPE